jgi:cytochrome c oxidase cbb3-type subunit 4
MQGLVELARSFWGVWLMLLFVGIVVWTMWPSRKRKLERQARIPFEDD